MLDQCDRPEEAKKPSVAVYNHYKRINAGQKLEDGVQKSNILLVGLTGENAAAQTLAQNVPFATPTPPLTEVWVKLWEYPAETVQAADYDLEKAKKGRLLTRSTRSPQD